MPVEVWSHNKNFRYSFIFWLVTVALRLVSIRLKRFSLYVRHVLEIFLGVNKKSRTTNVQLKQYALDFIEKPDFSNLTVLSMEIPFGNCRSFFFLRSWESGHALFVEVQTNHRWNEPCHEIMARFVLRTLILQTRMRIHPVGARRLMFDRTLRLLP